MAQLYMEREMSGEAVFELTVRSLPAGWDYLIAAGLERALSYLESLRFDDFAIRHLRTLPQFSDAFLNQLRGLRFSGDVWAPLEGSVIYPHEPLIQVVAPITEAQIVETALLNQLAYPTLVASKAARVIDAAAGRTVVEFGSRRAHGAEAALAASRAAWIGGFDATSSVEAGRCYDIPVTGTMAHSYILAMDDEASAFDVFTERYPGATLLVDTFETALGVERAITVAQRHGRDSVRAIRIDSGDFLAESKSARAALDAAELADVQIVISGGLDEHQIAQLVERGAPIDVFACGTKIVAPPDAVALDSAYKLVEYNGRPLRKLSPGKISIGGRKQVWRSAHGDRITPIAALPREDERPLLALVMQGGHRTAAQPEPLDAIRARAASGRQARHVEFDPTLID